MTTKSQCFGRAPQWAKMMFEELDDQLAGIRRQLRMLAYGEGEIMAQVSIEQGDLDGVATSLEALVTALGSVSGNLPAADESALNQAVSDLQGAVGKLSPPPAAPAPPADGGTV